MQVQEKWWGYLLEIPLAESLRFGQQWYFAIKPVFMRICDFFIFQFLNQQKNKTGRFEPPFLISYVPRKHLSPKYFLTSLILAKGLSAVAWKEEMVFSITFCIALLLVISVHCLGNFNFKWRVTVESHAACKINDTPASFRLQTSKNSFLGFHTMRCFPCKLLSC